DFHPREIGREEMAGDGSFPAWVLVLAVDRDRVMGFGAHTVIGPALAAKVTGLIVIVGTEIERPPHSAGVQNETTEVQVRVVALVIAALHPDKDRVRVVPCASKKRHLDAMKNDI